MTLHKTQSTCQHHFLPIRILFLGDKLGSNSGIRALHMSVTEENTAIIIGLIII